MVYVFRLSSVEVEIAYVDGLGTLKKINIFEIK